MWTEYLEHSRGPWKEHKYIEKKNGRYIYNTGEGKGVHKRGEGLGTGKVGEKDLKRPFIPIPMALVDKLINEILKDRSFPLSGDSVHSALEDYEKSKSEKDKEKLIKSIQNELPEKICSYIVEVYDLDKQLGAIPSYGKDDDISEIFTNKRYDSLAFYMDLASMGTENGPYSGGTTLLSSQMREDLYTIHQKYPEAFNEALEPYVNKTKSSARSMKHSDIDELYHHGILGQKWGQQNGPPYPLSDSDHSSREKRAEKNPGAYKRELNKLDRSAVKSRRTIQDVEYKNKVYDARINKAANRIFGRNKVERLERSKEKYNEKNAEKLKKAEDRNNEIQKHIDSVIKDAEKAGYTVSSKDIRRVANKGSEYLSSAVMSAAMTVTLGAVGSPFGIMYVPMHTVEGKKYKVKRDE